MSIAGAWGGGGGAAAVVLMCPLQGPGGCSSSSHVSIGGQVAVVLMCPL